MSDDDRNEFERGFRDGFEQSVARAVSFMDALHAMKGQIGPQSPAPTVEARYEALRERYANGAIELEDFTAGVVALLREGL